MPQRYDIGTLQPPKQLSDGRLIVDALLTRSGVFPYRNHDGTTRLEYRPGEEVFKADSIESLSLVPVTNDHPPNLIDAKNARQYAIGTVGETVRRDGDHLAARIVVNDDAVIARMRAGKRQVSCGYDCDLEATAGVTPSGERYDAIQRNIRYNHVAIVDAGRAGTARVRMDGVAMMHAGDDEDSDSARTGSQIPARTDRVARKDGHAMNLEQALAELAAAQQKLGAATARADAAEKDRDAHKTRADKAEGDRDEMKSRLDAAEKARKDALDATPTIVRARVALETKAAPIMGKDFKMDGLDDRAIQIAVIKKVSNVDVAADKSNDYVAARFDGAIERATTSTEVFQQANAVIAANRSDGAGGATADKGAAAMIERDKRAKNLFIQPGAQPTAK